MDIQRKSALVTGGASGLGAATVRMLAAKGAKVADRVVFIADGVVHETGTADEVLKHPKRERTQAFLARFTERAF